MPGRKHSRSQGDVITIQHTADHSAVAAGRGAKASVTVGSQPVPALVDWQEGMKNAIETSPTLGPADKKDAQELVQRITDETAKGKQADPSRLEKLVNTLGIMAPDIFDVAIATLANPLAGLGLVAKKIGERARIEQKA